MKGNISNT